MLSYFNGEIKGIDFAAESRPTLYRVDMDIYLRTWGGGALHACDRVMEEIGMSAEDAIFGNGNSKNSLQKERGNYGIRNTKCKGF